MTVRSSMTRPAVPLPSPRVLYFVALLAALCAIAFAAGRLAGPIAPGMHHTGPGTAPAGGRDTGGMTMPGRHR
ncbi:hypothetical protein [Actinoallomurus sp. CA-150999]|uniref:hypothetical protein n=1 Tax=Actinoallomurus sp. CA-150999 TaxID=3239887 RepID=UPI003D936B4E